MLFYIYVDSELSKFLALARWIVILVTSVEPAKYLHIGSCLKENLHYIYACVSACAFMHVSIVSSVARRHIQSLGAEVKVGYELPDVCAWNQTWVFAKSSMYANLWATCPGSRSCFYSLLLQSHCQVHKLWKACWEKRDRWHICPAYPPTFP